MTCLKGTTANLQMAEQYNVSGGHYSELASGE